ncbi:MAG: hypothetical protein SVU88_00125 [Candidatus Nanohaloarchaea archaeon]|nr:hypothetical protein [Candidatus Nanohaloarchaea archaeon]
MASAKQQLDAVHDTVLENGTLFAVLFYAIVTAFWLSVVGAVIQAVIESTLLPLGYAAAFGGLWLYAFRKQDFYAMLGIAALPVYTFLLSVFLLNLGSLAAAVGDIPLYGLVAAISLLLGAVPAYLFRAIDPDIFRYLTVGVYGTSVIAVAAGAAEAVARAVLTVQQSRVAPDITFTAPQPPFAVTGGATNAVLLLVPVFFNVPFLAYASRMEAFDARRLGLYLIPAGLYAASRFVAAGVLPAAS